MRHATVTLEVVRLPRRPAPADAAWQPAIERGEVIYSHDAQRLVTPASVLKLLTAATAYRTLGVDYLWPDSVPLIDSINTLFPGLECYNPDWLIEDTNPDYTLPLTNKQPDSGRLLQEVMKETLEESINEKAETMLRLLTPSCRLDSGLLAVHDYWAPRGLDMEGSLWMFDGCGLSPSDRMTAHLICSLLADMQFDEGFRNCLPVAGRTGTLKRILRECRLTGKAWLKSGTLKSVVAYAGYAQGSDSRTYAVSIFVNNDSRPHKETRQDLEKVLLSLIP